MFKVEADKDHGLLKIAFSGDVDVEQAKRGLEKLKDCLAELPKGFRMLTDLSELETMETGCVPYLRKAMDLSNEKEVSMVVRVIPDPHKDIGFNILSVFHYRRGVRIVTVKKLSEAMELIASVGSG